MATRKQMMEQVGIRPDSSIGATFSNGKSVKMDAHDILASESNIRTAGAINRLSTIASEIDSIREDPFVKKNPMMQEFADAVKEELAKPLYDDSDEEDELDSLISSLEADDAYKSYKPLFAEPEDAGFTLRPLDDVLNEGRSDYMTAAARKEIRDRTESTVRQLRNEQQRQAPQPPKPAEMPVRLEYLTSITDELEEIRFFMKKISEQQAASLELPIMVAELKKEMAADKANAAKLLEETKAENAKLMEVVKQAQKEQAEMTKAMGFVMDWFKKEMLGKQMSELADTLGNEEEGE
jgi:hypothetical protein